MSIHEHERRSIHISKEILFITSIALAAGITAVVVYRQRRQEDSPTDAYWEGISPLVKNFFVSMNLGTQFIPSMIEGVDLLMINQQGQWGPIGNMSPVKNIFSNYELSTNLEDRNISRGQKATLGVTVTTSDGQRHQLVGGAKEVTFM